MVRRKQRESLWHSIEKQPSEVYLDRQRCKIVLFEFIGEGGGIVRKCKKSESFIGEKTEAISFSAANICMIITSNDDINDTTTLCFLKKVVEVIERRLLCVF